MRKRGKTSEKRGFEYVPESGIWSVGIGIDKKRTTDSGAPKVYDRWRQLTVLPIDGGKRSYLACEGSKRRDMIRPDHDNGHLSVSLPDIGSLFETKS